MVDSRMLGAWLVSFKLTSPRIIKCIKVYNRNIRRFLAGKGVVIFVKIYFKDAKVVFLQG
jgi:hypothetical protein